MHKCKAFPVARIDHARALTAPTALLVVAAISGAVHCGSAAALPASAVDELGGMSLEQLANVQTTSVSK